MTIKRKKIYSTLIKRISQDIVNKIVSMLYEDIKVAIIAKTLDVHRTTVYYYKNIHINEKTKWKYAISKDNG